MAEGGVVNLYFVFFLRGWGERGQIFTVEQWMWIPFHSYTFKHSCFATMTCITRFLAGV